MEKSKAIKITAFLVGVVAAVSVAFVDFPTGEKPLKVTATEKIHSFKSLLK